MLLWQEPKIKFSYFIPQIEESKKILDNMVRLFNGDVAIIEELSNIVNSVLTKFYKEQIDNKSKPVKTLYAYIKSLLGFDVEVTPDNISNFFDNPNMINSSAENIIDYINEFESENLLDIETKLTKTLDILIKIYRNIIS